MTGRNATLLQKPVPTQPQIAPREGQSYNPAVGMPYRIRLCGQTIREPGYRRLPEGTPEPFW